MKKKFVVIIIFILCLTFIMYGVLNIIFTHKFIDVSNEFVEFRTYFIYSNNYKFSDEHNVNKLKKYKHVVGVGSYSSYRIPGLMMLDNNSFNITLMGTVDRPVKVIKGTNFLGVGNEFVMICPSKIYVNNSFANHTEVVDLESEVGNNIELLFRDSKEKNFFKLGGVYEASLNSNICYTRFSIVDKLNNKYFYDVYKSANGALYPLIVVLDDEENYPVFLSEIKDDFSSGGPVRIGVSS